LVFPAEPIAARQISPPRNRGAKLEDYQAREVSRRPWASWSWRWRARRRAPGDAPKNRLR